MHKEQTEVTMLDNGITIRLLKLLLSEKIINQTTYNKVLNKYKAEEAA